MRANPSQGKQGLWQNQEDQFCYEQRELQSAWMFPFKQN
jgi:hypothetical protein